MPLIKNLILSWWDNRKFWSDLMKADGIETQNGVRGPANIYGHAVYFQRWLNEHDIGSF